MRLAGRDGTAENYVTGQLGEPELERCEELRASALGYLSHFGWLPIPVYWILTDGTCKCGKPNCVSPGKHPILKGWQDLRPDEKQIKAWWGPDGEYPLANIGVLTGSPSGILPLDVDPDHDGERSLDDLQDKHGELPFTRMHYSGGGGPHYFFRMPAFAVGNAHGRLGKGLDLKGTGGYIIVPPSISGKGLYYVANEQRDIDPAPLPGWIEGWLLERGKQQRGERSTLNAAVAPAGRRRAYGKQVIAARSTELREAAPGARNDTLNACAFALGQLAPAGIVDEESAWQALAEAASACGLSSAETRQTFLSGWRKGAQSPFEVEWHAEEHEWAQRTWDGIGLGERMVDHFGDTLRWCKDRKTWLAYSGGTWRDAGAEAGEWAAQEMIDSLPVTEALAYDNQRGQDGESEIESPREKFLDWVRSQRGVEGVSKSARLCKKHIPMRIDADKCDTDPLLINLRNGVWDARTRKLRDHDPDDLLTLQAGVAHDEGVSCPEWDAFLKQMQPDEKMRAYLYRVAGYSMTADISEQALFLHQGNGANGKSVWHDVISRILGGYAQTVPMETLLASKTDGRIPTDVARMKGMRYLTASEAKSGKQLDEARVKELTGGETVAARFMRQDYFQFKPTGKIHLTSNHLLHITASDDAIWRRVHLITWQQTVADTAQNKHLADQLVEREGSGILNRLLAGLADWRAKGLQPPDDVLAAKQEYRKEEDTLGKFIAVELIEDMASETPGAFCSLKIIYMDYKHWCDDGREKSMGRTTFSKVLSDRGYLKVQTKAGIFYPQLTSRFEPPPDDRR